MKSKRQHEGYLYINHKDSPGISDELMQRVQPEMPSGAGKGLFEAATVTCSHCQVMVVINPLRTRARPYCPKCDHYICDLCYGVLTQTGACKTFKQIVDDTLEAAIKHESIKEI